MENKQLEQPFLDNVNKWFDEHNFFEGNRSLGIEAATYGFNLRDVFTQDLVKEAIELRKASSDLMETYQKLLDENAELVKEVNRTR